MVKVNIPVFTINIVSKHKNEPKSIGNSISRKCYAIVKEIEGEFKAVININKEDFHTNNEDILNNEQLILPFTDKSLELKNKIYVFSRTKNKYDRNICIIRDSITANLHPGVDTQYVTLINNCLIVGHIIRKSGKMYFNYEDLISFHYLSEYHINNIDIDDTKPLFNK